MRRIVSLGVAVSLFFVAGGCNLFRGKKSADLTQVAPMPLVTADTYAADASYDAPVVQPRAVYEPVETPIYDAPDTSYLAASEPASRYHTVAKRETLYSLARKYYSDHRRWKEIYEANRSDIGNPNKIFVGQRLLIP